MGIAVGSATQSLAVQRLFPLPVSLAAILNVGSLPSSPNVDQLHPTSSDVPGVKPKSSMVENLEAAVGIAAQSLSVQMAAILNLGSGQCRAMFPVTYLSLAWSIM